MSTAKYTYAALDREGKRQKGQVEATGRQEAFRKVSALGLTPLKIGVVRQSKPLFSFSQVKQRDIADLTREMAVLVEARIPIARGLMSIAEQESKPHLRQMIRDIAAKIESGMPITEALMDYRDVFGEVYIETMRAAETSGNLIEVMTLLAEMLDKQIETRQQMKRAMTYPVVVMSAVALAMTVIVVFVVPRFGETFAAGGIELPLTTQIVKAIGDSVKAYWWVYSAFMVASIIGAAFAWQTEKGRLWFEGFFLKLPYVRKVIIAVTAGRFARVFGIGLGSGLDVIEALDVSGRATGRPLFQAEVDRMSERLRGGEKLRDVLSNSRYLPSFARRMLCAGKDTQELTRACGVISRHYDRESDHLTKNVNTIIEPILTAAMAVIVLIVALSVFLPMWEMIKINK